MIPNWMLILLIFIVLSGFPILYIIFAKRSDRIIDQYHKNIKNAIDEALKPLNDLKKKDE